LISIKYSALSFSTINCVKSSHNMSFSHVSDESEQASNPSLSMLGQELTSPKFSISKGYDCGGKE
jgi:hypothetical protein